MKHTPAIESTPLSLTSQTPDNRGRLGLMVLAYLAISAVCLYTLAQSGDLSMGRQPWDNLIKTFGEFSYPSFLDVWFGPTDLQYRAVDGRVLRTDNAQAREIEFLAGLARGAWTTFQIATLGTMLAALLGLPLGLVAAKNLNAPKPLALLARAILDTSRAVHTLIFGLILVGIVGLGPTAGILAIALHSMGTYGKFYAESIETLDMGAVDSVRATGATPSQVFFNAVLPAVLPQFISSHLYIWEFNIRDSTILGLIGAGGLGLLISEATSLFQWDRLATILLVVVVLVTAFDAASRRIRQHLL
ncbi:phosphonate ABC transporter, permease protein PhnE [Zwartia panacis]|uniref:phosphonate ABC transporter, permease protein PhnE n=1 Tax=Zwartia panacis TaxID=2683345 RepID=UPI0025B469FA|nr:phosphonate ABC transporter, permease protein PhnE [Zwartia panacis]MDN4017643.1 phosphonate ABC transporter, permease protein PhnE [Zwartia panacis]